MQVLIDWPLILILSNADFPPTDKPGNFSAKETGEFDPDPDRLDPDSTPELESCLLLAESSTSVSSFDLEYLRQSCFRSWVLEQDGEKR